MIFSRLTIRAKLIASYIALIALTAILAAVSLFTIGNNEKVAEHIYVTLEESYGRVARMNGEAYDINAAVAKIAVGTSAANTENLNQISQTIADFSAAADSLKTGVYGSLITEIKDLSAEYIRVYNNEFLPAVISGDMDLAEEIFNRKLNRRYMLISHNLQQVTAQQVDSAQAAVASQTSKTPFYITLCVTLFITCAALYLAYIIPHIISTGIDRLKHHTRLIAGGDLSQKLESGKARDEINDLVKLIEEMRQSLYGNVSTIKDSSSTVGAVLEAIAESARRILEGAQETQSRAMTVAAASDEMVSTTSDIAKNCESAAGAAGEANSVTRDGVNKVKEAFSRIEAQVQKTQNDAALIAALADQSQKIGTIVETIDEIANQTNLLALNAAIEAARAGEAGKGFAVVADEVRALASRTGDSTHKITKMVGQIQQDASTANDSMTESVENMNSLASLTTMVSDLLHDIMHKVGGVNEQITQIATAADQQTTATAEISSNMHSISDTAQSLGGVVHECESNIEKANGRLDELMVMTGRFTL